jgi:hypothetical protein
MPPWNWPTLTVDHGTSKPAWRGSSASSRSAMSRSRPMTRAAISMALTDCGVSDECASLPRTQQRQRCTPLWAIAGTMLVGSPTMQASGAMPASRRSASSSLTPKQPVSSS